MPSQRLLAVAALVGAAMAQNSTSNLPNEFVWGAVILNTFADRIPLLSANNSVITPTGQNQMFSTGQLFRSRYVSPTNSSSTGNFAIQGIFPDMLNVTQVNITTMADEWVQQSAQAFMEGLYPPLNDTVTVQSGGPLNGFQNPLYYMASSLDPNYLFLNGSANCPAFDASIANWLETAAFQSEADSTAQIMNSVRADFNAPGANVVPDISSWFGSSYWIWDWLEHEALNNSALATDAQNTRYVADAWMQGAYGNLTADGGIRAIGGYTMAANILGALYSMVDTNSTFYPLNLFFTGPEPLISLGALMQLTNQAGAPWEGMPNPGSSLVFELFSSASTSTSDLAGINPGFPTFDNLQVRVLFRNGTNSTTNLDMQGMFGQPTSNGGPQAMLMKDFGQNMSYIAAGDPRTWCTLCDAQEAVWCAYFTEGEVGLPSTGASGSTSGSPISPTIAGVIGALVALAVGGLTLVAAMLCFGLRFRRHERGGRAAAAAPAGEPGAATSRFSAASAVRSPRFGNFGISKPSSPKNSGGFKGGEKLASDVDLPSGAAPFGASIVKPQGSAHERTESWELREQQEARRRMSSESERVPSEGV